MSTPHETKPQPAAILSGLAPDELMSLGRSSLKIGLQIEAGMEVETDRTSLEHFEDAANYYSHTFGRSKYLAHTPIHEDLLGLHPEALAFYAVAIGRQARDPNCSEYSDVLQPEGVPTLSQCMIRASAPTASTKGSLWLPVPRAENLSVIAASSISGTLALIKRSPYAAQLGIATHKLAASGIEYTNRVARHEHIQQAMGLANKFKMGKRVINELVAFEDMLAIDTSAELALVSMDEFSYADTSSPDSSARTLQYV